MPDTRRGLERPGTYGSFWKRHDGGLPWYTWMYESRIDQHEAFRLWLEAIDAIRPVQSVAEFGCGLAVGYAELFAEREYVGIDIAESSVEWCRANRPNPRHEYWAGDFIRSEWPRQFDLVLSQGTIDNTYDMDEFLRSAAAASRQWLYITAYRGFFPSLLEHQYEWSADHGCCYNNISPSRAYRTLREFGCRDVAVMPSRTGRAAIPFETLIVARVPGA
jgi:SAM-dependent methyltransferase